MDPNAIQWLIAGAACVFLGSVVGIVSYGIGRRRGVSDLDEIITVMSKTATRLETQQRKIAELFDILNEMLPEEKDG